MRFQSRRECLGTARRRGKQLVDVLHYAAAHLVQFDRFEQGLEIALAETVVALALDDLEEDRTDLVFGEDLQEQAAAGGAVKQDAVLLQAGDVFAVVESEARARELTEYRQRVKREKTQVSGGSLSLVDMMSKLQSKKVNELPVLIKADVQGTAEAIVGSLDKMGNDEVRARTVYSGAGGITESDVKLAKSAGAPILGFNVRASKQARDLAEREGVEIRYYSIIYDLLDDIKGVL